MNNLKTGVPVLILSCLLAATLARTKEPAASAFEPPEVASSTEPVYPAMAIGSGTVVLAVSLDADGTVQNVKVVKDSEGFRSSALDAIMDWKFKPATLNGKPVPSVATVAFSFSWPVACASGGRRTK